MEKTSVFICRNSSLLYYRLHIEYVAANNKPIKFKGKYKNRLSVIDRTPLNLVDDVIAKFEDVIKALLSIKEISTKFSEKFLEKELLRLIAKAITHNQSGLQIQESLVCFLNDLLEFSEQCTVLLPVGDIRSKEINEIQLGRVSLIKMDTEKINWYVDTIVEIIDSTKNTDEEKDWMVQEETKKLDSLAGVFCSEFSVIAEPIRARELAERETRISLDILTLGFAVLSPHAFKLGLKGEVISSELISITTSTSFYSGREEIIGPITYFDLSENNVNVLSEKNVLPIFELLKQEKRNNFQQALLNSIHWFSNSLGEGDIGNRFISLIIALESLLTPTDREPIGTAIAEGAAFILGDDKEQRRWLKSEIKRMYTLRSKIAHGGEKKVLSSDYKFLMTTVRNLILKLQHREFSCRKELLDWIEDLKFS